MTRDSRDLPVCECGERMIEVCALDGTHVCFRCLECECRARGSDEPDYLEATDLRERGVLIIGSGNIVHNLGILDFGNMEAKTYGWAVEFDEKVKAGLVTRNDKALIHYEKMGPSSSLAVPTPDHYLPMIYAIALREKDEPLSFTYEGFHHASISMRCFQIG